MRGHIGARPVYRPTDFSKRWGLRFVQNPKETSRWAYGYGGVVSVPAQHWPAFERDEVLDVPTVGTLLHEAMHRLDDDRPWELIKLALTKHRIKRGIRAYSVQAIYHDHREAGHGELVIERATKHGVYGYAPLCGGRFVEVTRKAISRNLHYWRTARVVPVYSEEVLRFAGVPFKGA